MGGMPILMNDLSAIIKLNKLQKERKISFFISLPKLVVRFLNQK
jgi:hypothetical protein